MPTISDTNTARAIAREYIASDKVKEKGLLAAGYKPSYARSAKGMKLYEKPAVIAAIEAIEAEMCEESNLKIKSRLQRQAFWSEMMDDKDAQRTDKLRASELLGKSEADFTENVINRSEDAIPALSSDDRQELQDMGKALDGPKLAKEIA